MLMSNLIGDTLGISMEFLKETPFDSCLIPGMVFFTFSGLPSLFVLLLGLERSKKYPLYLIVQEACFLAG